MEQVPETRYVKTSDGVYIAHQVMGDGPRDLLYVPGSISDLRRVWENPLDAHFVRALASSSRLVMIDRRGTGWSDPVPGGAVTPLEAQMEDVLAVLDEISSERTVIFGSFESGPLCMLFAATHPERTSALLLYGTYARGAWAEDYPWAWTDAEFVKDIEQMETAVLEGHPEEFAQRWLDEYVPSISRDPRHQSELRRQFVVGSPGAAIARLRMEHEMDVRAVLPTIAVPTLVMNRTHDQIAELDEGRWIAGQIDGATFVELPGIDHPPWAGEQGPILDAIGRFLGTDHPLQEVERVLSTILFTDIVGSTEMTAAVGDRDWADLLQHYRRIVRAELARHRGIEVDTAGDGFFATFDGPARAVRAALGLTRSIKDELSIDVRAGVHTGEVEVGSEGVKGLAVHIGARIVAMAGPSEVLASSTVRDLTVGSGLAFEDAGEHELKGVPDRWHLYRVVG